APDTPAFAADRAAYVAALKDKDGPAWKRAQSQLSVRSPAVQSQLMCAIGVRVDPTPASAFGRLMQRTALTLSTASEQSKALWNRDRPYVGDKAPVACDPELDFGAHSASYPSGHAGLGWLWGMLLAEMAPDRASQALAWGAEIGSNRIACRVHYPSDIAAGRQLGAALYARLQADAAFRADMAAAKAEVEAAKAAGATAGCPVE
ncbi:MAG: phosphatase PAP2 family protein, partial [Sphingomonadaceae bacterium]|nr:phosphatase PAP2 family protein [Sphingomonadaceae bacterium]